MPIDGLNGPAGALVALGVALCAALVGLRAWWAGRRRRQLRRRRRRGPGRPRGSRNKPLPSPEEFRQQEMVRLMRRLKRQRPAEFAQLLLDGTSEGTAGDQGLTVEDLKRAVAVLRELGWEVAPRRRLHPAVAVAEQLAEAVRAAAPPATGGSNDARS